MTANSHCMKCSHSLFATRFFPSCIRQWMRPMSMVYICLSRFASVYYDSDDKNINLIEYENVFRRVKTIAIYSVVEYAERNIEVYMSRFACIHCCRNTIKMPIENSMTMKCSAFSYSNCIVRAPLHIWMCSWVMTSMAIVLSIALVETFLRELNIDSFHCRVCKLSRQFHSSK